MGEIFGGTHSPKPPIINSYLPEADINNNGVVGVETPTYNYSSSTKYNRYFLYSSTGDTTPVLFLNVSRKENV